MNKNTINQKKAPETANKFLPSQTHNLNTREPIHPIITYFFTDRNNNSNHQKYINVGRSNNLRCDKNARKTSQFI